MSDERSTPVEHDQRLTQWNQYRPEHKGVGQKTSKRHWRVTQSWTSDSNRAFKPLAPIYEPLPYGAGSVMRQFSGEAAPEAQHLRFNLTIGGNQK